MPIKGLIFDAYGTLYDVHSVQAKTEVLCPGKGDLITQVWRLKQLEYTWLQTSLQEYRDFTYLTNGFDVGGAKHFGFKVAWIKRGKPANAASAPIGPAQMYRLLRGNTETLGYQQDYTVAALTDLIGLL